jgi:hypothetical protein
MVDDPQTWGTSDNIGYKTQTEDKRNKNTGKKFKKVNYTDPTKNRE